MARQAVRFAWRQLHVPIGDDYLSSSAPIIVWVDVDFDDTAVAKLHAWSGGHVDLARRICDGLLDEVGGSRPLARRQITAAEVDRTCRAMVAAGATFRDSLIPWLGSDERAVLHAVARDRPRSVRTLRNTLAGEFDEMRVGDALDHLREMGLVIHADGRETVPIELLARWIRVHRASQPHVSRRKRNRRMVIAATAAAALLLVAGIYVVWLRERMVTSAEFHHEECAFRFKHPECATRGDSVKLYVFRECRTSTDAALVLGELDATVATIDQRPLKFVKRGSRSERADVSIVLEQPDATGASYRFALERESAVPAPAPLGELQIRHDLIPALRRTLERAAEISMAALGIVLLGVALQRRVLGVLRRLAGMIGGRGRDVVSGTRSQTRDEVESARDHHA